MEPAQSADAPPSGAAAGAQQAVTEAAPPLLQLLHERGRWSGWALVSCIDGAVLGTAGDARMQPRQPLGPTGWPDDHAATTVHLRDATRCDSLRSVVQRTDLPLASALLAPIAHNNRVTGVIAGLAFDRPVDRVASDVAGADAVAQVLSRLWHATAAAHIARGEADAMERLALTDTLTGLPNRRAWDVGLRREDARSVRHGHDVAVVVVDLDELKEVNDQHGHAAGDDLIRAAATTLEGVIRAGDVLARVGGDEFGIVAVHCDDGGAEPIRQRVRDALDAAGVRASVGVAVGASVDGSLTDAWQQADALMYLAKRDQQR